MVRFLGLYGCLLGSEEIMVDVMFVKDFAVNFLLEAISVMIKSVVSSAFWWPVR